MNMMQIMTELQDLKEWYNKILNSSKEILSEAPEGWLRSSKSNGYDQFFHVTTEEAREGVYIRKKDRAFACKLAMKEYTRKLLQDLLPQYELLSGFLDAFDEKIVEHAYIAMKEPKRALISPYKIPNKEYSEKWQINLQNLKNCDEEWKKKAFAGQSVGTKGLTTEKGELVRSKSEKIIADKLFSLGIPYVYEAPLRLKKGIVLHPDFTILNYNTQKTMYWEHFGLLSNVEYVKSMKEKIEVYEENGLFPGKDLIFTYETDQMNSSLIGSLINAYGLKIKH